MNTLDPGSKLDELKNKIILTKSEIEKLGSVPNDMPEMIESGNLLRKNQYLSKANSLKSELVANYEIYVQDLEILLKSIFTIQKELQTILHDQNQLIAGRKKPKPKPKTRSKPKPKTRSKPKPKTRSKPKPKTRSKPKTTKPKTRK